MASSKITYTPITNIKDSVVVDDDLVKVDTYDSYMDVFTMTNPRIGRKRKDTLMNISLYDDIVIIDDVDCKVLRMTTI